MKQPVELYPDFSPLSDYLKDIEVLAQRMGVDVDDLFTDQPSEETQLSDRRKVFYIDHFSKRM